MNSDEQFLVMGAAFGLTVAEMRVFVESLRRHFTGPVTLLISSVDAGPVVSYLRSRGITPVFFDCPHWMVTDIQIARYIRYNEILLGSQRRFHRILLTDVSDVLFQAHPFSNAPVGELLCFMEQAGRTIGTCPTNSLWMEQIYGQGVLAQLQDRVISCSGTTIGSHVEILEYLRLLMSHAKPNILSLLKGYRGHDQAIHNYLLATGALPLAKLCPNGEHVFTLGSVSDSDIILGPAGSIQTSAGVVCPIVHQYNYKLSVLAHISTAFEGT